jgi:hypothetical protein
MPTEAAGGIERRSGVHARRTVLDDRSFEGVTPATWERMKATGRDEHGTVFEETAENQGRATTRTPVGAVVLEYRFEPAAQRITYKIVKRPMLATSGLIWGGIRSMIERCRQA